MEFHLMTKEIIEIDQQQQQQKKFKLIGGDYYSKN
mgnify:CR=1 FL=1